MTRTAGGGAGGGGPRSYPDAVSELPEDTEPAPTRVPRGGLTRVLATVVCVAQALVVAGWAVLEVARAVGGRTGDVGIALALAGLLVAFAVALVLLAIGWRRGAGWPKTPTIVWNLLLLPVAWSLLQAGSVPAGLGVGAVALFGVVVAAATPTSFGAGEEE